MTLFRTIVRLAGEDDDAFSVLTVPEGWRPSGSRPLLVIVHPGDALEFPSEWNDRDEGRAVAARAHLNQAGMAREFEEMQDSHDVVVLHRRSSVHLHARGVNPAYVRAVTSAHKHGAVLYGDDLEGASRWLCDNANIVGSTIFMSGAYADAKHGCISAIGQALLEFCPSIAMTVSRYSPTDSSNGAPRWDPRRTTKPPQP